MDKHTLFTSVDNCKTQTRTALQTVFDALNKGQRSKLLKDEKVKALFDLYEVIT